MARNGIRFLSLGRLRKTDREWLKKYYDAEVRPVLTPLAIDPAHPFPQLLYKSLNLMVELSMPEGARTRRCRLHSRWDWRRERRCVT